MSFGSSTRPKDICEPWDILFRKATSKEPCSAFTKSAENPIHWFQSLDTFNLSDACTGLKSTSRYMNSSPSRSNSNSTTSNGCSANIMGWPFMPFSKVQMFKCEKCCLDFCSPLNHRRHLRMIHRRPLSGEKEESASRRHQLATFWDNLCPEEANNIVVNKSPDLEDLSKENITTALSHLLQQPSVFALPHAYVKAGAMLLELVRNKSSRLSITSLELFKILDESSEKTFPSFGLSSMYRYVFEGDAGKVGLELKNLVASLGFLVEYSLVNAFIMRKDEEALRYQSALVEEEEASQRKQVEIRDKKKFKKARQKKLRTKDLKHSYFLTGQASVHNDDMDEEKTPDCAPGKSFVKDLRSSPVDNAHENLYDRLNHMQYEFGMSNADTTIENHDKVEETGASLSLMEKEDCKNESKMRTEDAEESQMMQKQEMYVGENVSIPRVISASKHRYSLKQKKCMESGKLISISKKLLVDGSLRDLLGTNMDAHDGSTAQTATEIRPYYPVKSIKNNYPSSRGMKHKIWARKIPTSVSNNGEVLSSEVGLQDQRNPDYDASNTSTTIADTTTHGSNSTTINPLPKSAPDSDICPSSEFCGAEVCSHARLSQVACPDCFLYAKDPPVKSVVIGSLNVPFFLPSIDLGFGGNSAVYANVDEVTQKMEVNASEDVHNSFYVTAGEESLHALHENVAIQSSFSKDCDKDGKSIKSSIHVNLEGKENQEYHVEEAKRQPSTKITGTVLSRSGETKMWRPVNRSSSLYIDVNERAAPTLSNRGLSCNSGCMDLKDDSDAGTGPDDFLVYSAPLRHKWIAEFLSQRWNEAVNGSPGSVILSLNGSELPAEMTDGYQSDLNNPGKQCYVSSSKLLKATPFMIKGA